MVKVPLRSWFLRHGHERMSNSKRIIKSSLIIGGSSFLNILISLIRTKAVAMLLGPTGIGLMGLLSNLVSAASSVAALGFGNVGVRQISSAAALDNAGHLAAARRALSWGSLALAMVGGYAFWAGRDLLATNVLKNPALGSDVGWLAIGVGLNVIAGSQIALLNGLRRIYDLAAVSVLSALLASVLGIPVLLAWGERGLVAYLLLSPLASFLCGYFYVARLPPINSSPTALRILIDQWRALSRFGIAIMLTAVSTSIAYLIVRTSIQKELGFAALGHFEAAWLISMTYIGFVISAMGTDYYPSLTSIIGDRPAVRRLVNDQAEVVILLAGPVLLAMIGLAPWVIELLYSSEFGAAVSVLRWQILGDVFKIASFPLAYIILAEGAGRRFMAVEISATCVFLISVWIGLPYLGLRAAGIAFFLMYVYHFTIVYLIARKSQKFQWEASTWKRFLGLLFATGLVFVLSSVDMAYGALAGVSLSALFAIISLKRLHKLSQIGQVGFGGILKESMKALGRVRRK